MGLSTMWCVHPTQSKENVDAITTSWYSFVHSLINMRRFIYIKYLIFNEITTQYQTQGRGFHWVCEFRRKISRKMLQIILCNLLGVWISLQRLIRPGKAPIWESSIEIKMWRNDEIEYSGYDWHRHIDENEQKFHSRSNPIHSKPIESMATDMVALIQGM